MSTLPRIVHNQYVGSWTEEEVEFLKENYHEKTAEEICQKLGRTEVAVYRKALRLGLTWSVKHNPRRWTEEQIQTLKTEYADHTARELASKVGHSVHATEQKIRRCGLKKQNFMPVPTPSLTDFDLGYLSGLVDGEGCIGVSCKKGLRYTSVLQIGNNDEGALEWCRECLQMGTTYPVKRKGKHKQGYTFEVYRLNELVTLLEFIAPHLKIKQRQAMLVLEFVKSRLAKLRENCRASYSEREKHIYQELLLLNRKGV